MDSNPEHLGVSTGGIGLLAFLNRHSSNSVGLRNALLVLAITGLAGVVKGLYPAHECLFHQPYHFSAGSERGIAVYVQPRNEAGEGQGVTIFNYIQLFF